MAIINFGKLDKNIIPILIGCILCFLSRLLFLYKGTKLFEHGIISNILIHASNLFAIIPLIILKRRTNNTNKKPDLDDYNNKHLILLYNDYSDDTFVVKDKYKYIFLSSLLYFIEGILLLYTIKIHSNTWIFDILFALIVYYLIFKIKLYKHHYLSIILIILTGIILDLVLGNLQNDILENISFFLLRLVREILFSSYIVVNKYLMEKKCCSVYEIIFWVGFIGLILLGIFSIFDYYYIHLDDFMEYINKFNYKEIFAIFGFIITQLGLALFILFTTKNNTPCHVFIIFVLGHFAYFMESFTDSIVTIICLIFILFMSLIFCEIIEINCFGLSKNTKNNIVERAESEVSEINSLEKKNLNNEDIKINGLNNLDDSLVCE